MPFRYSLNSIILGSPQGTHLLIGNDVPAELSARYIQAVFLWYFGGSNNGYFYEGLLRNPADPFDATVLERGYVDTSGVVHVSSDTSLPPIGNNPITNHYAGEHNYGGSAATGFAYLLMNEYSGIQLGGTGSTGAYLSGASDTAVNLPSMSQVNSGTKTGDMSFTNAGYNSTVTLGTFLACNFTFIAPSSGAGTLKFEGQILNSVATNQTYCSPQVRVGSTIGAGAVVAACSDTEAMISGITSANPGQSFVGGSYYVSGLTGGDTYNAQILHRVNAGTGRCLMQKMTWTPSF